MKKALLLNLVIIILQVSLTAQENNYWNIQYGTRSTLLGGAVIGSVSDLSATFYNPGAIALFPDVKFILSAQVYQMDNFTIKDGAAEGKDLDYSSIVPSPNFVAFDLGFDFLGDDRLAFSILTRQNSNLEFSARVIDSLEVIESSPGKESFAGGINTEKKFNDVWGGITYSTKLSEIIGLGITGYVSYRSHKATSLTILQALQSNGEIASYSNINNYRFNNCRTLLKAGVGLNLNPLTIGLTVTSPSLNIFGSGSVGTHLFISGIDSNRFDSNYQEDIESKFNSSWAAGLGLAYNFGKVKLHLSAEWYDAIGKYDVLDTEPYVSQSSGGLLTNDLTHEAKSVINFGLGLDYFASDSLIFSLSVTSDFSAYVENTTTNLAAYSAWDLIHIAGGSTFHIWKSEVTVGAVYSFGSQTFENKINITPGADNNSVGRQSEFKYSQIKVLLGFEI
jgi:opacity protein-like surface antigen